jgi:hypothetical protein
MTDLIKALRERREELRNELQEHPLFQEYELVCRLLERREASVGKPKPADLLTCCTTRAKLSKVDPWRPNSLAA